jgi:hypothetical protein
MVKSFHVTHLQPKHTNVKVHYGSVVTDPLFDAKLMILDIGMVQAWADHFVISITLF